MEALGLAHRVEEQPHLGEQEVPSGHRAGRCPRARRRRGGSAGWPRRRPPSPHARPLRGPPRRPPPPRRRARGCERCRAPAPRARRGGVRGRRPRRRRPPGWPRPPRGGARGTRMRSATSWLSASRSVLRETPRAPASRSSGSRVPGRRWPSTDLLAHHPRRPVGRGADHRAKAAALGEHVLQHRVEAGSGGAGRGRWCSREARVAGKVRSKYVKNC